MITDRYQGICMINEEGWKNMDSYDGLEPHVRRRLAHSAFNLCPRCVASRVDRMQAIRWMEAMVRNGDVP